MVVLAPLAVGLGIGKAGVGIMGAIGNHLSQSAQARAQNEAAINRYKLAIRQQQSDWAYANRKYSNKLVQYKQQLGFNQNAASRAYEAEQMNLNNLFQSAAFQQQAMAIQAARESGRAAARGVSGQSARLQNQSVFAQYGRNLATQEASLRSALEASGVRRDRIRDQLSVANQRAYAPVAVGLQKPMELPKPVMVSGPSGLSLATNIGGALLDGASGMLSANKALS